MSSAFQNEFAGMAWTPIAPSNDHCHIDLAPAFENEFVGLAQNPVSLRELQKVRARLKSELPAKLTADHRQFLISLMSGEPGWKLMQCPQLQKLPAIRWKLQNLARLKKTGLKKFAQPGEELRVKFARRKRNFVPDNSRQQKFVLLRHGAF